MKLKSTFRAAIITLLSVFAYSAQAQNNTCLTADPFCTGTPITFPAGTAAGTGEVGPDYGCLLTQPNPAWYYMEIDNGGNLDIEISNSNNEDIDFILYGPFVDQTSPCTALLTAGNTEDCSYSTSATETANIVGANPGEFYLMMITNFSNNPTDISFGELPSSTATTNCAIVCPTIDFGVYNGATTEQTPLTNDCDDPAVLLLADEDGFNPGEAISPCIVIQVFPTNANATLSVEFFENGTSLGTLVPNPNTNWSGFLSLADPNVSHAFILDEGVSTGANMSYEVLDCHTGTVLASGTWVDDGNPQTVTVNPPPNLSGTAGFTVTPASGNPGLTTFDWGGAVWDPSAVPPGSYDITYSWNDGAGNCSGTATHTFVVTNPYTSTFSYAQASYCQSDADPSPTITGTAGGTFSSTPGGLALNSSTGAIDVSSSGPGTYDISYFTGTALPSTCNSSTTVQVTIVADQDPSFGYSSTTICQGDPDPSPTVTGDGGGSFSGTGGLSINAGSGLIDLSASTAGGHTITYTTPGPCAASTTFNITINVEDDPAFTYPSNTYCAGDADPSPTITGTGGGSFSGPAQVSINGGTGAIDLSASTPGGPYTITYTTPGPNCPNSATFNITINPDQDPAFTYASNTFCAGDADPSPTITGTAGGTFSGTAGLSIIAGTGVIDLSASTTGSHTITYTTPGPCAASTTFNITINPEDDPSFSYSANTFCAGDADPTPTITGTGGGTFSGPAQVSITGATGVIDLSASTPGGPYTITYTTPGPDCPNSSTFQITINPDQDASFSYPANTFCADDADPTPTITGDAGGTFSGTGGLVINGGTGVIDLDASTTGAHTITYTTAGPCAASTTFNITINPEDDPSFSYSANTYCAGDVDPTPTITGTGGGTFSGPAQVSISGATGVIDLSTSTVGGPYTITYTTPGPNCPNSSTFQITINPDQDASFSYASNTFCAGDADPTPTITGDAGGSFSGTAGLVINAGTGEIDLDASTTGGHTVTYTTPGPCAASATFNITINAEDDPSFSYSSATFCESDADPSPTVTGTAGGTFSGPVQVSISSVSGTIDLGNSTVGGPYTITYTTPGPNCPNSTTFDITILPDQDPSFSYASTSYCADDADPTPTITGDAGGNFSGTPGLVINPGTGEIDLDASTAGGHTITYTTPGPCAQSTTFNVTINVEDDPAFAYGASTYCSNWPDPTPTITGTAGGTFSAPVGVVINTSTGEIDLGASTAGGPYTISYTTPGPNCPNTGTFDVTINAADDSTFSYSGGTYCLTGADPIPTISGTAGGTFSGTAGLVINGSTGEIDLDASGVGSYTVTYNTPGPGCPTSFQVPITITTAPSANFNYTGPYCQGDPNAASPTFGASASAGTFSFTIVSGGPTLAINPSTGDIDLTNSDPGTYDVTNDIAASGGCAAASSTAQVTVLPQDDPGFSYASPFCQSDSIATASITGTAGGVFSEVGGATVVFNSTATGEIDLQNTPAGTYTIQYLTAGTCIDSSSVVITINADDDPAFSFAQTNYCAYDTDPLPTITGTPGGTFSALPAGLVINSNTGEIDLDASVGNTTYDITYTTPGPNCPQSLTVQVTVDSVDDPGFSYSQLSFCTSDPNQFPTISGATGGTFSSIPVGLVIDPVTGEVDVSASAIGNWTVMYLTNGTCPDSAMVPFTITNALDATISSAGPFCSNDAPVTLTSVDGGGTWSGPGITDAVNGTFDPSQANIGVNEVIYIIAGSCGDVDTLQITVDQSEDPTITNAPTNVCEGSAAIDLSAVDEVGTWSGPGITDANTGIWDPSATIGAGSYTIYHTIATNCGGVDSVTIVVDPLPSAPVALDETMCLGDAVPSLDAVGGGGTFTWYDDAGCTNQVGSGASFTPTVGASGAYTFYVSETLGNCEGPCTPVTLTVGGPTASFTPTPSSGQIPLSVYFDNTSTGGNTYNWDFGDGGGSTLFDPNYTYVNWGDFTVLLTVTDAQGCTDTASFLMDVDAESDIEVPNVFSPNDDQMNDSWGPETENLQELNVVITNRWGAVMHEITTVQGRWDGRTSSGMMAAEGTYYFVLIATGADGTVYTQQGYFTLIR